MRPAPTSMRLGIALAAAAALTACGQRGALYLPEESSNVVVTPAPSAATPAADPAAATPDSTEEQRRNTNSPAK